MLALFIVSTGNVFTKIGPWEGGGWRFF